MVRNSYDDVLIPNILIGLNSPEHEISNLNEIRITDQSQVCVNNSINETENQIIDKT